MEDQEESTAVLRMQKEYESFLSKPSDISSERFRYGSSQRKPSSFAFGTSPDPSSVSLKSLFDKEKSHMLHDAELLAAKSKISNLESQLNNVETSRKRARIEYDNDMVTLKTKYQRYMDKYQEMKNMLEMLKNKEEDAQQEAAKCRQMLQTNSYNSEQRIHSLLNEQIRLEGELQSSTMKFQTKISELKNEISSRDSEFKISQTELSNVKEQLKLQVRKNTDSSKQLSELDDFKLRTQQAEQTIKELELKLSRVDEDAAIVKSKQTQLDKLPVLERTIRQLKEENNYLKETQENVLLLKEQCDTYRKKWQRAEHKCEDFVKLQSENEEIKKRLKQWETTDVHGTKRPQSPSTLVRRLEALQASEALLLEKQGQLTISAQSYQAALRQSEQQLATVQQQNTTDQQKLKQQEGVIKKLQRKVLFLSKECEGYKNVIESYEGAADPSKVSSGGQLKQLKELLTSYQRQLAVLENEHDRELSELKTSRLLQSSPFSRTDNPLTAVPLCGEMDHKTIANLRTEVAGLQKQLEKLEEEKEVMLMRLEQRQMQGDYDPTTTKVVHFKMNPAAMAQQQRQEELASLKEENSQLKQRLKLLEESGGSVQDLTLKAEEKSDSNKEIQEIKGQLVSAELKNKRLMEVFKKTSQEFREVVYQLLGYKIDIQANNNYRLMSMYAESSEDYIIFHHSSEGEMQLLGTPVSPSLTELIQLYLHRYHSIPAFLSSNTMQLFSQQTIRD